MIRTFPAIQKELKLISANKLISITLHAQAMDNESALYVQGGNSSGSHVRLLFVMSFI